MWIPDPRWESGDLMAGRKPTGPVVIDWGHASVQSTVILLTFSGANQMADLVSRARFSYVGSNYREVGPEGEYFSFPDSTSNGDGVNFSKDALDRTEMPSTAVTIVSKVRVRDSFSGSSKAFVGQRQDEYGQSTYGIGGHSWNTSRDCFAQIMTTSGNAQTGNTVPATVGVWYWLVARWQVGRSLVFELRDDKGDVLDSDSAADPGGSLDYGAGSGSLGAGQFQVGYYSNPDNDYRSQPVDIAYVKIDSVYKSDAEIRALIAAPYEMLIPA